ncbi:hypothetical protein [Gilvimarinus algae]|uniref:DUF2383 domain-containing protein n=1 Tax=Gilvimarinus algae TaxID=3058037 RepID=A0ABT8TKA1_9GAMM|nr:hypothetical protein [Gilvimarinus sp. SDUM040014]MDO3383081.1 hypothetical protein [Gilvimarinus sp. SDUM040014]
MSVLRNDVQVALNDVHVAFMESADHYRDAADFLNKASVSRGLIAIAEQRDQLVGDIEKAIRDSGDLPSVPDTDRETGEQLIQHLTAMFSADETQGVLQQRREDEQWLQELLDSPELACLAKDYQAIVSRCRDNIEWALEKLDSLS